MCLLRHIILGTTPISKQGLNREAWAELLKTKTWPECPEGNLRELI